MFADNGIQTYVAVICIIHEKFGSYHRKGRQELMECIIVRTIIPQIIHKPQYMALPSLIMSRYK
jgi:hypothetical protein